MEGGCLTNWPETVEQYLATAQEKIPRSLMMEVLTKLYYSFQEPMDPFIEPMMDIYLHTHILDAECMLEMDIPDIIREKLHDFVKELYM